MVIKNLAFKGGGILGMVYAGALKALEEKGHFSKVEQVAGTSVGAVTALSVSLGYSPEDVKDFLWKTNFKNFQDSLNIFSFRRSYGLYQGTYLLDWVKAIILKKHDNPDITFSELEECGFKYLKVFATDLTSGELQVFSSKKTPDVRVAEAVRASMSIPLYFRAWRFSNGIPNDHYYVDGGLLFNYPLEAFNNIEESLGFYIDNVSNDLSDHLQPNEMIHYIKQLYNVVSNSQDYAFFRNEKLLKRSIIIPSLGISSTNFDLRKEHMEMLYQSGYNATITFFEGLNL